VIVTPETCKAVSDRNKLCELCIQLELHARILIHCTEPWTLNLHEVFQSITYCFPGLVLLLFRKLKLLPVVIYFNPLNAELNPICHLLTLLGAHHILHFSRISVKLLFHWLQFPHASPMSLFMTILQRNLWIVRTWTFIENSQRKSNKMQQLLDAVSVQQLHVQHTSTYAKPEATIAVLGSWWKAVCRPKHAELHINMKEYVNTLVYIIGFSVWIILWCTLWCTLWSTNIRVVENIKFATSE
jgi:hypothetical protein